MPGNCDPKKQISEEPFAVEEEPSVEELKTALEAANDLVSHASLEIEKISAERDAWKSKAEAIFEQYARVRDDMEGYRRRTLRDREETIVRAKAEFIKGFLDVLDNFDRFLSAYEDAKDKDLLSFVKGVDMIKRQILDCLKKDGLEEIPCPVGHLMDPALHEAVSAQDGGGEHGTVLEEIQKGFTYKGTVIRASKVRVIR